VAEREPEVAAAATEARERRERADACGAEAAALEAVGAAEQRMQEIAAAHTAAAQLPQMRVAHPAPGGAVRAGGWHHSPGQSRNRASASASRWWLWAWSRARRWRASSRPAGGAWSSAGARARGWRSSWRSWAARRRWSVRSARAACGHLHNPSRSTGPGWFGNCRRDYVLKYSNGLLPLEVGEEVRVVAHAAGGGVPVRGRGGGGLCAQGAGLRLARVPHALELYLPPGAEGTPT
jgi:hypothetical protein